MTSILSTISTSLLDSGRKLAVRGFGLSSSARAVNQQLLSINADGYNKVFSLAAGNDSNIEGAKVIINALRSKQPDSSLSRSVRGVTIDQQT